MSKQKIGDSISGRKQAGFSLIPETAKEALGMWDNGDSVFTVEMGGLGPGYEQCIHISAFELIRELQDQELPESGGKQVTDLFDGVLFASETVKALGLSGAQAGAAKQLAYKYLKNGYRATLDSLPEDMQDRKIQVSKNFPESRP